MRLHDAVSSLNNVSMSMSASHTMDKRNPDLHQSATRNIYLEHGAKLALRFTVYHRLSLLVILPNLATILYEIARGRLFNQPTTCLNAVAANVAATVLIRQDHVINLLFRLFGLIPHWSPLCIRKHAAKLYHLGGIHSGAGFASGLWFLFFNIAAIRVHPRQPLNTDIIATIFLSILMDVLLLQMLVFSMPVFRSKFHNFWELMHRFSGWLLLICFWIFFIIYNIFNSRIRNVKLSVLFYSNSAFYLLTITTISIVVPWLSLRQVVPRVERLSSHAMRLHFSYANVGPCRTPRFSTSPLTEWHSFASIPNFYTNGFSIIVSRAGDWTSQIIDRPPTKLWTRGNPACGVLYMAKMFRRILCVGTGSGIAPILGLLVMPGLDFRVLWSTPDPGRTFGADVVRRILKADPSAVIWDTRLLGRPDLISMALEIYEESKMDNRRIEAVFVISNARVTAEVVFGLEEQGLPAFGPIFDS